jgi:hypothetical protein
MVPRAERIAGCSLRRRCSWIRKGGVINRYRRAIIINRGSNSIDFGLSDPFCLRYPLSYLMLNICQMRSGSSFIGPRSGNLQIHRPELHLNEFPGTNLFGLVSACGGPSSEPRANSQKIDIPLNLDAVTSARARA